MAGIGSEAVGGLSALQASLRQRVADQIAQQERERLAQQQTFQNDLAARRMAMDEDTHRATQERLLRQERDTAAGKVPLTIGDTIDQPVYDRTFKDTSSESLFSPQTSLPATQIGGGITAPMLRGRLVRSAGDGGAMDEGTDTAASSTLTRTAAPQALTGRLVYAGTAAQRATAAQHERQTELLNDPNLSDRERRAIEMESVGLRVPAGMYEPKPPQNLVQVNEGGRPVYRPASEAAGLPAYHPPQSTATVTIQTVDANGNPVTRVVPKAEAIGKDFAAKPNATTANRLDSAKAVQQTGEDIIAKVSDPKIAALLGPAMGRYNSLREFLGNPPPELSELAGQIESYALANMGVHGMRSAQGAEHIKQLLDRRHTPESLASTVRGLNGFSQHFLENAGRGAPSGSQPAAQVTTVRMRAPNGQETDVPADQVEHFKARGAVVVR